MLGHKPLNAADRKRIAELEQTFGRWIDLQALWQRRVAGELSDDQARQQIEARAARAQTVEAKDKANVRPAGRPKTLYDDECVIQGSKAPTGTSTEAALRRLRKDAPSLHARVLAGEISPHAAMVQAGFRKPLDQILKLIPKLSPDEARVVAAKASEKALSRSGTGK